MNHLRIYESIIANAKLENREKLAKTSENYVYYENHHIIPRCVGGGEEKENKVLLTAKEHFVCHKLLIYIYPKSRGLALALRRFLYSRKNGMTFSSKDYAFVKNAISLIPVSKETCEKLSKAKMGKHPTDVTRKKQSDAKIGKPSGKKGKSLSQETKNLISASCLGYQHTEKTKEKFRGRIPWNKGLRKEKCYSKDILFI
jgi:hypothetical protein